MPIEKQRRGVKEITPQGDQAVDNDAAPGEAHKGPRGSGNTKTPVVQEIIIIESVWGGGFWFVEEIYWCAFKWHETICRCRAQYDDYERRGRLVPNETLSVRS